MEQEASAELVFSVTGITREEQIYLYTDSVCLQREHLLTSCFLET